MTPRVSVVVPTIGRPLLAARAVRSALAQTLRELEVLAVIDGPDPATVAELAGIDDSRLRVVPLLHRVGIGGARNAGARSARGRWIAFLDDDDEWAPTKVAVQLPVAEASRHARPIVACRIATREEAGRSRIWPRRLPDPGEPLSEYLLARRGPFWGEGVVHTSTLLVDRALLEEVPFREDLAKHEDLDWLLRAARLSSTGLEFVPSPEPLAIWDITDDRPRASRVADWRSGLSWARSVRELVTPRAYAAYLLGWLADDAAAERSLTAFARLPVEAFRRGRPKPVDVVIYLATWAVPRRARSRVAARFQGRPS